MKQKLLVALTLLLIGFGQAQNADDEDCIGKTYFALSDLNVYTGMNTNSDVIAEVPAGDSIVVSSMFFENHGWFKVCYNGSVGHAEKDLLSETAPDLEPTSTTESIADDQDGVFRPFLARATKTLNFRSGPSTSSTKIKAVGSGSSVFVFYNKPYNNYYKAIDISTGQVGWAHKNFIRYYQSVVLGSDGNFKSLGNTSAADSQVYVVNNLSDTTRLVIGTEMISLSPNSTGSITVSPGRKFYIAITPGEIPVAGYQVFEASTEYEWSF